MKGKKKIKVVQVSKVCLMVSLSCIAVSIASLSAEGAEVKKATYCVIDVSKGPKAAKYPVSYLDAIPALRHGIASSRRVFRGRFQ